MEKKTFWLKIKRMEKIEKSFKTLVSDHMQGLDGTWDLSFIHIINELSYHSFIRSFNEWELLSLIHSFIYQIVLKQHFEPGTKQGPRNTTVNEDTFGPCPYAAYVHYSK